MTQETETSTPTFDQYERMKIMIKNFSKYLLLTTLVLIAAVSGTAAAEKSNMAMAGAMMAPYSGSLYGVRFEHMLSSNMAVGGSYSSVSYDCWGCSNGSGDYHEWGSGSLIEVTFTYHFSHKGFIGPFIGPAIGLANMSWSWYDYYSSPSSGDGTTNAISYSGLFGWDFALKNGIIIRPLLTIGSWGGSSTDSTGTQKSSLGAIAAAGVYVGWRF